MRNASAQGFARPSTSLIGRERDIAQISALLLGGPERLVTLTGMGGVGKTRLACCVAANVSSHFPHGVWLVELASITDPQLVITSFSRALAVGKVPNDGSLDVLKAFLEPRTLLIVIDNCEHVIDECAVLAESLLVACPELRILATSREPLKIRGERQWPVPFLPVPDPAQLQAPEILAGYPSIQLFVERAIAVEPDFKLTPDNATDVAGICARVGGLPLALELAATRVRALPAAQILQLMDNNPTLLDGYSRSLPARQQTLTATLDWSYGLLSLQEQMVFCRLAVFVGGCSIDGAQAVCAEDGVARADVLDVLVRLVDKSLVLVEQQSGRSRYRLLEPVRQYAAHLLADSGQDEATYTRLAAYCVDVAERAEPELWGPRQVEWLRQLDREFDNIRIVLRWAQTRGDSLLLVRLAGALHWYFMMRQCLREGKYWLEAWEAGQATVPGDLAARALVGVARLHNITGDSAQGLRCASRALATYQKSGDNAGLSYASRMLSFGYLISGDLPKARTFGKQAVAFAQAAGSGSLIAKALVVLAITVYDQGEAALAVKMLEQALGLFRRLGDRWAIGNAVVNLASFRLNYVDSVGTTALSSIRYHWEQRDYTALAAALEFLVSNGYITHTELQVTVLSAASRLRQSAVTAATSSVERDDLESLLGALRARVSEERFAAAWAEGQAVSVEEVVATVLQAEPNSAKRAPEAPARISRNPDGLTAREREIAELLLRRYTDREIAEALSITAGTTRLHVHHLLRKLGLRSRFQLTRAYVSGAPLHQGSAQHQPTAYL